MDSVMDDGDMLSKLEAEAILPVSAVAMKYFICRSVISIACQNGGSPIKKVCGYEITGLFEFRIYGFDNPNFRNTIKVHHCQKTKTVP